MADLRLNINGQNNAGPALNEAAGSMRGLTSAIEDGVTSALNWQKAQALAIQFAKDSVRAYEEQARADRQLARVAGESTEAFKRQASALQESLGVSDDMVETMQKMLLTYGQAPAEVDKTVRAILDLSAATGQDAVSAVNTLTSSVTTGRTAFKELGLEYEKTGDKSKDLAAITEALAKKFSGAAADEANSLSGSLAKTKQQFGELEESFGGLMATVAQKSHVLEGATTLFHGLARALSDNETLFKQMAKSALAVPVLGPAALLTMIGDTARVGNQLKDAPVAAPSGPGFAGAGGRTINVDEVDLGDVSGRKGAADAERRRQLAQDVDRRKRDEAEEAHRFMADLDDRYRKAMDETAKKWDAEELAEFKKTQDEKLAIQKKTLAATANAAQGAREAALNDARNAVVDEQREWANAGAAIGVAFAGALSNAINELASGGEYAVEDTVLSVMQSALAIIGGVVGAAYGGPAGGALGSAAGNLVGTGITAAVKSGRKRHGGGWALDEMPHYHSGAWVGGDEEAAILQKGERVLSQAEVANMGGSRGVENAARGGSGSVVNIQTFDAGSFREIFQGRGGRGILDAVRTGVGVPAQLFGAR